MNLTAVLVLYRQSLEQSAAYTSLRQIVTNDPSLARRLTLLIYDNSPEPLTPPLPAHYFHNPANPGLAAAYNRALDQAETPWLLLLDQDTVLSAAYLAEALDLLPGLAEAVAAVLPQLVQDGHVHSPQLLPRLSSRPLPPGFHGVPTLPITAFNSGAILRVASVKAIHGFPTAFPLDFLDHATFHALAANGGKFHVLRAKLQHDLSTSTLGGDASLARYKKILAAERRFYAVTGGVPSLWRRLRRIKQAAGHLIKVSDKRFAWQDLLAALGLVGR